MTPIERIHAYLHRLYPHQQATITYARLKFMLEQVKEKLVSHPPLPERDLFSEQDVTLITYGDSLQREGETPLHTLHEFLKKHLKGVIPVIHILPFYPYSSDDGFSVIDYYAVDPKLGSWEDVTALSADFRLMFDAVINHASVQNAWFQGFLRDEPAYQNMFFTESPDTDLSSVTRPRTSPLLTAFQKSNGETVHVWTTFSDDQVDLDYRNPETLLKILEVLLFYVEKGAQVIRLDAIAYAWKEVGTPSIHQPQVHTLIQLIRAALDVAAPQVVLITETNVPHAENVSYFGDGENEAQMVYNFTLPPLLLHTLISGDAGKLADWINTLKTSSERTSFFNFTASHDGIGVRPVEGILNPAEVQALIAHVEQNGGRVSYKNNVDGSRSPYELNIAYVDATANPAESAAMHVKRFLLSQAIMLSLAGVPAVYLHSLLGSHNDLEGMEKTRQNRSINRAKLQADAIEAELADPGSFRAQVFHAYVHLLKIRAAQPAFHPRVKREAWVLNKGGLLALNIAAPTQYLLPLFNMTAGFQRFDIERDAVDLLTGETFQGGYAVWLEAYQVRWLNIL